jgi:hypothetical protein
LMEIPATCVRTAHTPAVAGFAVVKIPGRAGAFSVPGTRHRPNSPVTCCVVRRVCSFFVFEL